MSNVVLLDNVEHHDLKIRAERGEAFGDHINQVLVFPNEFRELQRDYPIFFRQDAEGAYQAVALLGLDRDENLFLKGTEWDARYIPAVQARGPFSIGLRKPAPGQPDGGEPMIRIDLDSSAISKGAGHALFLPQGGFSPYLEHMLGVLRILHTGVAFAGEFFAALQALNLIEPVSLEIKLDDTKQYSVPGVSSINEERFRNLPAADLEKLHRADFLAPCFWVLSSLENVSVLVERKSRVGGL